MKKFIAFFKDEDGLETVEYAVAAFLIVAGLTAAFTALGDQIGVVIGNITGELGG